MTDQAQFARLESKVDKIADAMLELVRVDEQNKAIRNLLTAVDTRVTEHGKRITHLERTSDGRGTVLRLVDRAFWILLTAGVGLAAYYIKGA